MKNTIIISAGVLVVVGIGWFVVSKVFSPTGTQTPVDTTTDFSKILSPDEVPLNQPGQSSSGDTISVATEGGGSVQTNNFKKDPDVGQYPTPDYYYLGFHTPAGDAFDGTATANPPYLITYIDSTQYFNIGLLQEPIGTTRIQVEQYLMSKLGISQGQMCRLQYMLSVPNSVNQSYSGTNLGFSFCPGAVQLP